MAKEPLNLTSARRKIASGAAIKLNFGEVRDLGLKFHQSWEREIEMAVDAATGFNCPLTQQFFMDARGPMQGYSGAMSCLRGYICDPVAPALTAESFQTLESAMSSVIARIEAAVGYVEVSFDGVEYSRYCNIWHHAPTGKELKPVKADGSAMSDLEFSEFLAALEREAKAEAAL